MQNRKIKKIMQMFVLYALCIIALLALVSCEDKDFVCCYGYFPDTAFVLIYSNQKNELYYVNVPLDAIAEWSKNEGIESVQNAIRKYVGIDEDVFITGNTETLQACRDILDALSSNKEPSILVRLETISKRASVFIRRPLIERINSLCNADLSVLLKAMADKEASVAVLDGSAVLSSGDMEFSNRYFKEWISQIIFK